MTDLRTAAQQALEKLEYGQHTLKQISENQWESRGQLAIDALKAALVEQEHYDSPYNPNPVEYQYHYPDGSWKCSNGEVINGMRPDRARSLYALKDNT